jgi:uncharacterized protein YheU (UPF0270 family)
MIIPLDQLDADILRNIAASFVLREGTDYGVEVSFDDKINQVLDQLKSGQAVLSFDMQTETINIIPKKDLHLIKIQDGQDRQDGQDD